VKETFDPIKPWFLAAQELGEYIGIRFGHIAPEKTEPEWIFLPHIEFDGIGGFADILRKRGATIGDLPQIRHQSKPAALSVLKLLPNYLRPRHWVKLKPLERDPQHGDSSQPPTAVAWHIFDKATTLQIRNTSRKIRVTVNSFLLQHLTKAIRPFLEDYSSTVPWMIPVNLRGKVFRDRDTANFSSYISVRVKLDDSVQDIHRNIYAVLDRKEHWANWYAYEFGRFTTQGLRKFLIKKELATSQWNLGGFSNLGDWDAERKITPVECQGSWLFCPPVLRFQLIGAGCVTFQNRLSLLIQAHPELTTNPTVCKSWIQNWVKEIESNLPTDR
jgi:NRPS condensation-like uncharacterized protein